MTPHGPAPQPLEGRYRGLLAFLRAAALLALLCATAAVLLGGRLGEVAALATVTTLLGAHVGRVLWLSLRWLRRGDRLFAGLAGLLLVLIAAAGISALWR